MGIGNIANTGMQVSMSNMEVISNNIANVNTPGYKRSYGNFADLYPAGNASQMVPGMGVSLVNIQQDFTRGDTTTTGIGSDLSINNNGFFILRDPVSSGTSYSRAGQFTLDQNGYLVLGTQRLQGFGTVNGVITAPALTDIQISNSPSPAKATSTLSEQVNLDSGAQPPVNPFSTSDATSYNFRTDVQIYDSLGNPATATLYYVNTGANNWTVNAAVGDTLLGSGTLTFSGANGALTSPPVVSGFTWSPTSGASAPQSLSIDFTNTTQFAGNGTGKDSTTLVPTSQDGNAAGSLEGYSIDGDGVVTMHYSNGQSTPAGQVALAMFQSPSGLNYQGNMSWTQSSTSGAPLINQSNSTGSIVPETLEASNVELTTEMIDLISAQHSFQANAQVEQTYNEVMQTVIQL